MGFDDYTIVLYRQDDRSWVAEIPALGGCYALMDTREAALTELEQVFALIAQEYHERGQPPLFFKILRQLGVSQDEFERLR